MDFLELVELNKEKLVKEEVLKMDSFFMEYLDDMGSVERPAGFEYISQEDFEAIEALSDKIFHMTCNIGCPSSVRPMLQSIVSRKVKSWLLDDIDNEFGKITIYYTDGTKREKMRYVKGKQLRTHSDIAIAKKNKTYYNNPIKVARGHFRWNNRGYILSRRATELLAYYFGL